MTTTVPNMQSAIDLLRSDCPDCKIIVGGAVLTREYAEQMGADAYGRDAMATVRFAEVPFVIEYFFFILAPALKQFVNRNAE